MKQKHIKNGEIKNYRVWANLMRTCLTQGLKMPCVAEFTHSYGHRHVTKTKRKFTPIEWALLAKEYHIWLRFMMHPGHSGNRVATNSIKLHVGENKKSSSYLWIDPPWAFGNGDDIIESSDSCPDHKSGDYEPKFRQWVSRFSPIFTSSILDIQADVTGQLSISLSDGYRILVPEISPSADDSDLWYDHWYYKDDKSE